MSPIVWTSEQNAILASSSRVTLVRAGPGSGKTKVFVECLNRYLDSWKNRNGGIAALLFTNVAREQIEARLGGRPMAPHFIGTLDSFFLRFIIGPFGHLVGITRNGARLIPSPLDEEIRLPTIQLGPKGDHREFPLFRIGPCAGTEPAPEFRARLYYGGSGLAVHPSRTADVYVSKEREWGKRGRITHSDSHYLASLIISGSHGNQIRRLLARRFPVILVDELQDTGHFLGRALVSLLGESSIAAALVGDEDQRIFGFSGVDPALFQRVEELEGCKSYPLRTTQRCAVRVSSVASALARSGAPVEPKMGASKGAAVLLVHDDSKVSRSSRIFQETVGLCCTHDCKTLGVLTRRRDEKRALIGSGHQNECPMKAMGSRAFHKAVTCLIDGRGDLAARMLENCLGHLLIETESPSRDELEQSGIDPAQVRGQARRLVLQAAELRNGEKWGEWSERMKAELKKAAINLGGKGFEKRLGAMFRQNRDDDPDDSRLTSSRGFGLPQGNPATEILTIHEAKGREFDAVLLYFAKPTKPGGISRCPCDCWWSTDQNSEEREIAFVVVTRARRLFVLAVHADTFAALKEKRSDFLSLFEPVQDLVKPQEVQCR
jgi:DNA helicase-2/ATP-dependent DNA helicase PcrA